MMIGLVLNISKTLIVSSDHLWIYFSADDAIRCQHTSSPLGNGAIVETSDKNILVLQRSHNVGEFPGHFVFPGGHPEVSNLEHGRKFTPHFVAAQCDFLIACLCVWMQYVYMYV